MGFLGLKITIAESPGFKLFGDFSISLPYLSIFEMNYTISQGIFYI